MSSQFKKNLNVKWIPNIRVTFSTVKIRDERGRIINWLQERSRWCGAWICSWTSIRWIIFRSVNTIVHLIIYLHFLSLLILFYFNLWSFQSEWSFHFISLHSSNDSCLSRCDHYSPYMITLSISSFHRTLIESLVFTISNVWLLFIVDHTFHFGLSRPSTCKWSRLISVITIFLACRLILYPRCT